MRPLKDLILMYKHWFKFVTPAEPIFRVYANECCEHTSALIDGVNILTCSGDSREHFRIISSLPEMPLARVVRVRITF